MFWWFEKNGVFARCEVLHLTTGSYELRVVREDGSELIEQFDDPNRLARRQQQIEDALRVEGWTGPHGWVL